MIKMTAKEFDNRFENEDVNDLMEVDEILTINDLKKELNNHIELSLNEIIFNKLIEKSKQLDLSIGDTAKVILAKELGVL